MNIIPSRWYEPAAVSRDHRQPISTRQHTTLKLYNKCKLNHKTADLQYVITPHYNVAFGGGGAYFRIRVISEDCSLASCVTHSLLFQCKLEHNMKWQRHHNVQLITDIELRIHRVPPSGVPPMFSVNDREDGFRIDSKKAVFLRILGGYIFIYIQGWKLTEITH